MSYIRIANEAPNINRLLLEKLGLSTKRDDANTIGQFGSGSKFAPIAALRNGWRWVNVGADDIGEYQMEYVSIEENGIDCIYYKYETNEGSMFKPSSFTLEAGVLSWDADFQIFREAFSNALDENILNDVDYSIDVVDDIYYEEGMFAVFLTASPELLDIVNNFDIWFSLNRTPLYEDGNGSLFQPMNDRINIYHKNVHVYSSLGSNSSPPLFDYSLKNVTLNEERRLRDTYYATTHIADLWSNIFRTHPFSPNFENCVELATRIILKIDNEQWEFENLSSFAFPPFNGDGEQTALHQAWLNIHGKNAVMTMPSEKSFTKSLMSIYDKRPVMVNNAIMYEQLAQVGVPTIEDILGDEVNFDFITLCEGPKATMLEDALDIVARYDNRLDTCVEDIKVFAPSGDQSNLLGVAKDKNIYLSLNAFSDLETLIGTVVHELDHVTTGIMDNDPAFRNLADSRIAGLLLQIYGDNNG